MQTIIINDCSDANAMGRQSSRAAALMQGPVTQIGVKSDLEAAGNIIDILDSIGESPAVLLVNVAPRNGRGKKWENGTPFGYFWYKQALVVASVDGLTLSLVKKLQLTDVVHVMDIPTAVKEMSDNGAIASEFVEKISKTQFRSLDFIPRVAAYLLVHKQVAAVATPMSEIDDAPNAVWWIDNFGNAKTTLLEGDCDFKDSEQMATNFGTLPCYRQLKAVPDASAAITIGSSGIDDSRFIEIVVQGESAAQKLGIRNGSVVL